MTSELEHLELLAELDALVARLQRWIDEAPDWQTADECQALVRRLIERAQHLRVRFEAPLVVATLGGTGTGKSTLVNALVGAEVATTGRQRPTTRRPTLICRPDLKPEDLGIDPEDVQLVQRDTPALRDLVLLDCPDPDTSEDAEGGSNLQRLRELLPFCDVLLVTGTQQKYRSARVAGELASAAPGARLVFLQTHAETDDDIRDDWRTTLEEQYVVGDMFFVDSLQALADTRKGLQPRGDFGRLVDLLTRELATAGASRIRRANLLDLVRETLAACRRRVDAGLPAIEQLEAALVEQRQRLSQKLAGRVRDELLACRRGWENRLLGEIASQWGLSPFSLVLRASQALGYLISRATLSRVRTLPQLALWGTAEGVRQWKGRRERKRVDTITQRATAWGWDEADLRTSAIILDGYVDDAGLVRDDHSLAHAARQAEDAGRAFAESAADQLQSLLTRMAHRHTGWFTRMRYEIMFLLVLVYLALRWGWNFLYASWWLGEPMYGAEFLVNAGILLVGWSALLLWVYSTRLRSGIHEEVDALVDGWRGPQTCAAVFAPLEDQCRAARRWSDSLARLEQSVDTLGQRLSEPTRRLGHRIA